MIYPLAHHIHPLLSVLPLSLWPRLNPPPSASFPSHDLDNEKISRHHLEACCRLGHHVSWLTYTAPYALGVWTLWTLWTSKVPVDLTTAPAVLVLDRAFRETHFCSDDYISCRTQLCQHLQPWLRHAPFTPIVVFFFLLRPGTLCSYKNRLNPDRREDAGSDGLTESAKLTQRVRGSRVVTIIPNVIDLTWWRDSKLKRAVVLPTKTLHSDTKLSLALTTPRHVTATVSMVATFLSQSTYMVTYSCKLVSCNSARISLFSVATLAAVHPRRSVNSQRLTDSNNSPIMSTLLRPSRAMPGSAIRLVPFRKQSHALSPIWPVPSKIL